MSKHSTVIRQYKLTDHERAGLDRYNSDLRKVYQKISDKPGERASLVRRAFRTHPDRYQLCHEVARLTRLTHDSDSQRVPASVNRALGMLGARVKKFPQSVAAR